MAERTYNTEIQHAIRRLNDADIAVHAVDARGLSLGRGYVASLQQFAAQTGGRVFRNRNDLASGIRAGLDDLRISYTIGYYQPDADAGFRRIRVRVNRPDVTVRHRMGYEVGAPLTGSPEARQAALVRALRSPIDARAIPITLRAMRENATIHLTIIVDPTAVKQTTGKFDLVARLIADDGSDAAPLTVQTVGVERSEEKTIDNAMRLGSLTLTATINPPSHAKRLRLLIRDQKLDTIGTITVPLAEIREQASKGLP